VNRFPRSFYHERTVVLHVAALIGRWKNSGAAQEYGYELLTARTAGHNRLPKAPPFLPAERAATAATG